MANKKLKIPVDSSEIKKASENVEKLEDSVSSLNDTIDDTSSALSDIGVDTGVFDSLKGKISGAVNGAKKFIGSMRTLKGAIAATGIGLLVVALGSLFSYFKNSEKGARTLSIASEALGVIVGKLTNFATDLGEKIFNTFSNPKQAIQDLKDAIVENITNRVTGLIQLFPKLGEAIKLTFKGQWREAAKVSADAIAMVTLGVEDATDKAAALGEAAVDTFNNIVQETKKAVAEATKYVDGQENLRKTINSLTVENAKLTKELETQQKIGEDTTRGYDERKAALEKAEAAQLKLAQNVAKQAALEEKLLRTDIAKTTNVEERRELENQLSEKIAARIDAENSLAQVQLDLGKVVRELDIEEAERKQGIADIIREANEDSTVSKLEAALTQSRVDEEAAIRELETLRATEAEKQAVRDGFAKQRADLEAEEENAKEEKRIADREKFLQEREIELTDEREIANKKYQEELEALQTALQNELITEVEFLELKKQAEADNAKAITEITKKEADEQIAIAQAKKNAQLEFVEVARGSIVALGGLFEEGTAAAKAAALADIAIGTAVGFIQGLDIAQKSAKGTGPGAALAFPIFYATQIAAVLAAAGKAKQALSATPGGGSTSTPTAPTVGSAPTPPSISLFSSGIGSSSVELTSQGIGSRQTSFRAYVVESDITDTQNTLNRYKQRSEIG